MKLSEIKEIKKGVEYVDGKRVVEWVYMVRRDSAIYPTFKEAQSHLRYLRSQLNKEWKKVSTDFMNDVIDYEIIKEKDYYFTIVTDLATKNKGWAKLEGTLPYQRKEAIIKAYQELGL